MAEFWIALAVFFAAHVLPRPLGWRDGAIARFGRRNWLIAYSLVSTATLVWLVSAALRAPYVELWAPSAAAAHAALALMPVACVLFVAGAARPNPASVAFLPGEGGAPGMTALTRHPILWSFAIWGGVHVWANGDLVSVILFGAMTVFALIGIPLMETRARRAGADLPPLGPLRRRLRRGVDIRLGLEVLAGLALYALALHLHEAVIGVDPLMWL